jgi:hypothetical protein
MLRLVPGTLRETTIRVGCATLEVSTLVALRAAKAA